MTDTRWTATEPVNPGNRKFVCRIIDQGIPSLEAIRIYDFHIPENAIYVKNKKAVNELIKRLEELGKDLLE